MTKRKLSFWYDFASTYSYLSAMRIVADCLANGVEVVWRPFLLGPIFKAQGWTTSPFNIYPAKGRYMIRDMERLAKERGLDFHSPDPFPSNSLHAARMALVLESAGLVPEFTRAVFALEFGEGADISAQETLQTALDRAMRNSGLVVDFADVLAQAGSEETKAVLRQRTEAAATAGLFGAPSFVAADGELFWGDDRLDHAITWAAKL